jgi:hypothetical protein
MTEKTDSTTEEVKSTLSSCSLSMLKRGITNNEFEYRKKIIRACVEYLEDDRNSYDRE